MADEELYGIKVPELEDEVQEYARTKESKLEDVVAPTLEDVYTPPPSSKKSALDDIAAPVLEDTYTVKDKGLGGLDDIKAPTLEDTYVEPKKEKPAYEQDLEAVKAALLEDDVKPNYQPRFVDTSAEEARKEALHRSIKSSLSEKPASYDEKKSLEMYRALMEEKQIELAKKGGKKVIVLMILGIIMSVVFYLFATTNDLKPDRVVVVDKVATGITYCCIASGVTSFIMLARSRAAKGLASFVFGLMTAVSLIGGGYILTEKTNFAVNLAMIIVVFVLNVYISFSLGSSEAIDLYYKGKNS